MNDIVYIMIKKYMDTLSYLGYINNDRVFRILVMEFLREILSNEYSKTITETEHRDIERAISCLEGSSCEFTFLHRETYPTIFTES